MSSRSRPGSGFCLVSSPSQQPVSPMEGLLPIREWANHQIWPFFWPSDKGVALPRKGPTASRLSALPREPPPMPTPETLVHRQFRTWPSGLTIPSRQTVAGGVGAGQGSDAYGFFRQILMTDDVAPCRFAINPTTTNHGMHQREVVGHGRASQSGFIRSPIVSRVECQIPLTT